MSSVDCFAKSELLTLPTQNGSSQLCWKRYLSMPEAVASSCAKQVIQAKHGDLLIAMKYSSKIAAPQRLDKLLIGVGHHLPDCLFG